MSDQLAMDLSVPTHGRSRRTDPTSSVDAGRSVNASAQIRRIHAFLGASLYGYTRGEIAQGTGIRSDQVSSRLAVMESLGLCARDGVKVCRETGRTVTRWTFRSPSPMVNVKVAGDRL